MSVITSPSLVLTAQSTSVGGVVLTADNPLIGHQQLLTTGTIEATTEDDDHPAANLANSSTYLFWQGDAGSGIQFLTFTPTSSDDIDYIGLAGHNFGSGAFQIEVEGAVQTDSSSGLDWMSLAGPYIPDDDKPILFRFEKTSYLGLRVVITPTDTTVQPRCAVMYVGELLVLERRIYVGHKIARYNTKANIVTNYSEVGTFLGRIVLSEMSETSIEMRNITPSFYRTKIEPWRQAAIQRPFFFAWRPYSYPDEVGFLWSTGDMDVANQSNQGFMQATISASGVTR